MATLASSTDPVALIPGSLEALYGDADQLDLQADDLVDAADRVRRGDVAGWIGSAAAGWDERRPIFVDTLDAAADVHRACASVLRAHAETLTWARAVAQDAVDLYAEGRVELGPLGEVRLQLAERHPSSTYGPFGTSAPSSPNPFGSPALLRAAVAKQAEAEALLASARADVDESATAAAEILDLMCEGMPDGQWHTSEFLAGLWSWVTGIVMFVARFNSIRATLDWQGFATDSNALGEGVRANVAAVSDNPHDFGRVFFDTQTLHDNPGRWFGAMAPDAALTVAGGIGAGSRSLSAVSAQLRAMDWADDTGAVDLAAWLRRDPITTSGGSTLHTVSAAEEAAAAARVEALPEGAMKAYNAAGEYQASVYGPSERLVTLADGTVAHVDGFSTPYGLVPGDAKLVLNGSSSIYIPESIGGSFSQVAIRRMDDVLIRLDDVREAMGGSPAVEIVVNNAQSAAAWEARMRVLGIEGYARIQP